MRHLTDVYTSERHPELNRATRKGLERDRLAKASLQAQLIKVADLISNTRSIVAEDPKFAVTYLQEKAALLRCFSFPKGSPAHRLQERAWSQLNTYLIPCRNLRDRQGDSPWIASGLSV